MEARSLVYSRQLQVELKGVRKEKEPALIPWADSINHSHMSPTKWDYEAAGDRKGWKMVAYGDIAEGKEVPDTYFRMLPDNQLMLQYGFVAEKKNPNTMKIDFLVSLLDNDPMMEKKLSIVGNKTWKMTINEFDSNEMNQLLSFLRIKLIDEDDYSVETGKKMAFYKEKKYLPPLSSRNEKKVLDLFQNMCVELYNKYDRTLEADRELLENELELSYNVRNALRITIAEKEIIHSLFESVKQINDFFGMNQEDAMEFIEKTSKRDFKPGVHAYLSKI